MTAHESREELRGLRAYDFPASGSRDELPEADAVAWRVRVDPFAGVEFADRWQRFLETVPCSRVRGLIIGEWDSTGDSAGVVERLVAARDRLTGLEAVFLGDVPMEELEITRAEQTDVKPLLDAYPGLRELGARGGPGLALTPVRHAALHTLTFESAGLPGEVVRGLGASELPALERLDVWLGTADGGGSTTVADLAPLLEGGAFPRLRHLGVRNCEMQDEVAVALASAPVVGRLRSLGLSSGVLTDEGAEALLAGQSLAHLERLDLSGHYLSDAMTRRLRAALTPHGVEVDLSGGAPRTVAVTW